MDGNQAIYTLTLNKRARIWDNRIIAELTVLKDEAVRCDLNDIGRSIFRRSPFQYCGQVFSFGQIVATPLSKHCGFWRLRLRRLLFRGSISGLTFGAEALKSW
jgi:hypothetical protein